MNAVKSMDPIPPALPGAARTEDLRLLTGRGRYVADRALSGGAQAVVVRSPHAHARILRIDTAAASAAPGVLAVIAADDPEVLALGLIPWELPPPVADAADERLKRPLQPVMARGVARYLGEPVAFVVAETLHRAMDAAELVDVDYQPRSSVTAPDKAVAPGAPALWPEFPDNVYFRFQKGDAPAVEQAFAQAAHVVEVALTNNRVAASPLEPRTYAADWEATTQRWTLYAAASKPHLLKRIIAGAVLGVDVDSIRVLTEDVGGGFGAKNQVYPEQVLVLLAARRTGRPVTWTSSRGEMASSDAQGRDQVSRAALALDADGRFLAIRASTDAALGAYLSPRGIVSPIACGRTLPGAYRIPAAHVDVRAVFTNTVPTAPYRGAGQPETMFLLERLIDLAARRLGVSPVELRRRNLIPATALPYENALGIVYDTGDYAANLDRACVLADWQGFPIRREESRRHGRLRGIGLSYTIEACGMHVDEQATVRLGPDGRPEVLIGTMSNGQGHATVYAQIVAETLGCAPGDVTVVQGDTDRVAKGNGTGASRSLTVGGTALLLACRDLAEAGRAVAAELLQSDIGGVEPCTGGFRVAGTGRQATWQAIAAHAGDLAATRGFNPANYTFPNGCHVAEVEVDPDTGAVRLLAYAMVHDVGRAVNPAIVGGQLHGGVAQGIGQALLEHMRYDATGQVVSATLLDYALPRADNLPAFQLELNGIASTVNPLGARSVGEAGPTAAPPAVVNALLDALAPLGVAHVDMPATPQAIWRAIQEASRK